ncbi:MAG: T9SS type A sorting domain-containing protein [Bacteroidia bacterium]|nr:T9SS type A sorting domain-containing protein [Bacteroidia bacterium]
MKKLILTLRAVKIIALLVMVLINGLVLAQGNSNGQGNDKIKICHCPDGNPNNCQTITISIGALDAHLALGDYVGPCINNMQPELLKVLVSPNPYATQTNIEYDLREESLVKIDVYNQTGYKIHTIVNETKQAGKYSNNFSAKSLGYPSGIYLLKATVLTVTEYVERSVIIVEIDY